MNRTGTLSLERATRWGYSPTVTYDYDPEAARQLLDDAGWPSTAAVDVVVFEGTAGASTADIVATGAATVFDGSKLWSLIERARLGDTLWERRTIFNELAELFDTEVPYIQLYYSPVTLAWDPEDISGTPRPGLGPCDAWNLKGVAAR